jgi:hypothetical protein
MKGITLPGRSGRMAAAGCLIAAALAAFPPETDVRELDRLAALASPDQRIALLTQARHILPRDTATALELGLELERAGQLAPAEAILTAAARLDRQYQPAWTLANFYFRSDNPDQFWIWAARASTSNHYDLRPLLRLATIWAPEPHALLARLGDHPTLLRPYLDLLIGQSRFADAQYVASLLRAHNDPADLARLEALQQRLRTIRSAETP